MRSRIRELRRAQKLSQAELADAVGTTRQTITLSRWANTPRRFRSHTKSPAILDSPSRKYLIFPK